MHPESPPSQSAKRQFGGNCLQPNLWGTEMLGSCRLAGTLKGVVSVKLSFQEYPKTGSHWTSAGPLHVNFWHHIDKDDRAVIILLRQALCHTVRKMQQSIQSDRLCRLIPDIALSSSFVVTHYHYVHKPIGHPPALAFPHEEITG